MHPFGGLGGHGEGLSVGHDHDHPLQGQGRDFVILKNPDVDPFLKNLPLNGNYKGDPHIKALKKEVISDVEIRTQILSPGLKPVKPNPQAHARRLFEGERISRKTSSHSVRFLLTQY